ncbi:MAG: NrfD/PsrC family molybdoenzyme membrane anchor subunit [Thermincolia bacterium]
MAKELAWGLPVALYLFLGGAAAAAYYIGVIADLASKGRFRNIARASSYIVLVPMGIGLVLLLLDLGQPARFWYLMFQTSPLSTGLVFHPSSVMSLGVWILIGFSLLCGIVYPMMWLAEDKKIPGLADREGLRRLIGILGLPFAFLVVAYTGVLLAVTSTPVWADTPLLPVLFVVSATSTGFAAIILALLFFHREESEALTRLEKGDSLLIKLEMVIVAVLLALLLFSPTAAGPVKNLIIGDYAVFFWVGFVFPGLLLPFIIQQHVRRHHSQTLKNFAAASALLVLFGGFFLRYIILLAV